MARRNTYPGRCAKCRKGVPAMAGFLEGPPWQVVCQGCAPDQAAAAPQQGEAAVRIERRPDGDLLIRAAGYLGDFFDRFRDVASSVAEYDPSIKANLAPREALLEVMRAFKNEEFKVSLSPELAAELQAEAEAAKATSAAASARIEELRARFAKRNLTMRIYQETGVAFLAEAAHGRILADDPGTGKTIMGLASWKDAASVLVVCPVNARGNWEREIAKWRPDLSTKVLRGDPALASWPVKGQVLLGTYDFMRRMTEVVKVEVEGETVEHRKLLLTGTPEPRTVVIADEGHRLANKTSGQRKSWDTIVAPLAQVNGRAFLFTGSPVLNSEKDMWSLMEACGGAGTIAFGSRRAFGRLAKEGGPEYVQKVRRVMLRRTKAEVLKELPPIQYTTVDVEIDDKTRAALDEALAKVVEAAVETKVEEAQKENAERAKENKARGEEDQVALLDLEAVRKTAEADVEAAIDLAFDGKIKIPFELISRVKSLLATAKLPTSLEILDDLEGTPEEQTPGELFGGFVCDDPITFASAHAVPVETVAARPGWAMIRGGVTADKRTKIVEDFQAGKYRGISLGIKAASEAITITRSSRLLVNDPEWTPAAMAQLVSRIHRMGQAGREGAEGEGNHVQVIRLVAKHVLDQRIQEILDVKGGIVERVVEAAAVGVEHRAASVAAEIEAELAAATIARPTDSGKRAPKADGERAAAAVLLGSEPLPSRFLESVRTALKREGGLTEAQWAAAVKSVKGAYVSRPAKTDLEQWAARGLRLLAAADTDRATEVNGAGFSKWDGGEGHDLARKLEIAGVLPDDDWRRAVRLASKYTRQIGDRPWSPLDDLPAEKPRRRARAPEPEPDLSQEHAQNPFDFGGDL